MSEGLLTTLSVLLLLGGTGLAVGGWFGRGGPAGAARLCIGSGGYVLLLVLVGRGLQVGGLPLASAYEAALLTAAATALVYALGAPRRPAHLGGLCAGGSALALLALSALTIPPGARAAQPPPAALAGVWFLLHVGTTTLGYGGLVLAGSAGLVRLVWKEGGGDAPSRPARVRTGDIDALVACGLAWGYPLLTLGMAFGALWGWLTWGRYWSWSVKEVLALIVWGLFTLALHTRRLPGWSGKAHSAVLVAGLAAIGVTLLAAEALVRWLSPAMQYVF